MPPTPPITVAVALLSLSGLPACGHDDPHGIAGGPSATLVFARQPTDLANPSATYCADHPDLCWTRFTVQAVDSSGLPVETFSEPITITLGANPGAALYAGTLVPVRGAVSDSLSGLPPAGGYTLRATAVSATGAESSPFRSTARGPDRLNFGQVPLWVYAGAQVTVHVRLYDRLGPINDLSGPVVTLRVDSGPDGGAPPGTLQQPTVAGAAQFTFAVTAPGTYRVAASSGSLVASRYALVAYPAGPPGPAAELRFIRQPNDATQVPPYGTSLICGFGGCVSAYHVQAFDAAGVPAALSDSIVVTYGTAPEFALPYRRAELSQSGGMGDFFATFNRGFFTLVASTAGVPACTSRVFTVFGGAPSSLRIRVPADTVAFSGTFTALVDIWGSWGGRADEVTGKVVTISADSGPAGGTLQGTLQVASVNGVANFTGLSASLAGTYRLTAASDSTTIADHNKARITVLP